METVIIRIASSTFVKVIAATNRTVVGPAISTTKSTFIAGENITAGNALYIPQNINGFQEVSNTGGSSAPGNTCGIGYSTTNQKSGQSFFAGPGRQISSVKVKLTKSNNPTGNLTMKIYSGLGTGLIATSSNTIAESSVGVNPTYTEHTFNFSNESLVNGLNYIEISADRVNDTSFYTMWITGGTLSGTSGYTINSSNTWLSETIRNFSVVTNIITDGKAYKTDASNSSKINFIGFATNTVSTGGNVIVDTSGVSATQTINSADIGKDFYLSNTPGAISATPGTNVRRIGKSVSTTAIELETSANNSLEGALGTTATTGSVTLGNAVGYITVKINGVDRKIPYYS